MPNMQIIDELDNQLGHVIRRSRFSCEQERSRSDIQMRILTEPVVDHDDP